MIESFQTLGDRAYPPDLLPKSLYARALNCLYPRKAALQVFLGDPQVPLDTNHIERRIRSIAMGRRN